MAHQEDSEFQITEQRNEDGEYWIEVTGQQAGSPLNELLWWWMRTSFEDFVATVPKMVEYGGMGPATDLLIIGGNLAELLDLHDAPDPVKMELGCWFYMQGKVARLVTNYKRGEPGKVDSWFDAGVYAKMARRIQEAGTWP